MISIQGLKKKLGSKQVLNGVDLEIVKGETIVIMGRSGTGKSVLLKHIIGLMEPDAESRKRAEAEVQDAENQVQPDWRDPSSAPSLEVLTREKSRRRDQPANGLKDAPVDVQRFVG